MSIPFLPCFTFVIGFTAYLTYRYKTNSKHLDEQNDAYFERESKANITTRRNLDNVNYITIPEDIFPFGKLEGEEAGRIEAELRELSALPMANFSHLTNTDLKEQFGVNHFEEVSEIGDRYERLSILLTDYAKLFFEAGDLPDAVALLEFGMKTKSDCAGNYILLGRCYQALGQTSKLHTLREYLPSLGLTLEKKVTEELDALLALSEEA